MTGKLLDPVFHAGPDDKLAVVDVYEKDSSSVVNSYQEQFVEDEIEAVDNATPGSDEDILSDLEGLNNDDLLDNVPDPLQAVEDSLNDDLEALLNEVGQYDELDNFSGLSDQFGSIGSVLGGDMSALTAILSTASKLANFVGYSPFDRLNNGFDLNSVVNQLANGNTSIFSSIRDLPSSLQGSIGGGFGIDSIRNNVFASVGNTMTRTTYGMDYNGLQPVTNICSNLTGGSYNAQFTNRGGLSALIAGVSHIGNSYNLPNVFSSIAKTVTDPIVLTAAARPLIQRAAYNGDVDMFRDVAGSSVGPRMTNLVPGIVSTLISNMAKPAGLAQQEYPRYYQNLRGSMDTVQPGWNRYNREGGSVVNATVINSNPFMCDLMQSQMNQLMHPDNYLSNLQSVYPERLSYDSSTAVGTVVVPTLTGATVVVNPVDSSNVQPVNLDPLEAINLTNGNNHDVSYITESGAIIQSFDDEPFLMLGQTFKGTSVNDDLQKHFPEFHATLSDEILPIGF